MHEYNLEIRTQQHTNHAIRSFCLLKFYKFWFDTIITFVAQTNPFRNGNLWNYILNNVIGSSEWRVFLQIIWIILYNDFTLIIIIVKLYLFAFKCKMEWYSNHIFSLESVNFLLGHSHVLPVWLHELNHKESSA